MAGIAIVFGIGYEHFKEQEARDPEVIESDPAQAIQRTVELPDLRRAVLTLEDYDATLQQEIAQYSGQGAPMPPDSWTRRWDAYERDITEDLEAQGIPEYVKEVNEGRVLAGDEARLLSARFKLAFDTMRNLSDYARLVAGIRRKNVEVEDIKVSHLRHALDQQGAPGEAAPSHTLDRERP